MFDKFQYQDIDASRKGASNLFCKFVVALVIVAVTQFAASVFISPSPAFLLANTEQTWCERKDFTKITLKTLNEATVQGMLWEEEHHYYEGSDVVLKDGKAFVVFDSLWEIGVFDTSFARDEANHLLPLRGDTTGIDLSEDSSFEGIAYDPMSDTFFLASEAGPESVWVDGVTSAPARIFEASFSDNEYIINRYCDTEKEFTSANKGIEGLDFVRHVEGGTELIALCEGNFCEGGKKGKQSGNGRAFLIRLNVENCIWETQREYNLPVEAFFQDYSGIAIVSEGNGQYTAAVSSQENSAIWIGKFSVEDGFQSGGEVFHFLPNDNCQTVYCNIEGIAFLNDHTIFGVSDKMKSKGRQDFRCRGKDQSLHLFGLPDVSYP